MNISRFLATFLLLLILPVSGQELPQSIKALLLSAQGEARASLGQHESAAELFRSSVALGGPVEPLIRNQLLLGRHSEAEEVYRAHRDRLEDTDRELLKFLLTNEADERDSLKLQMGKSHHSLYLGLVLHKLGQTEEAKEHLSGYVQKGDWGFELGEGLLLQGAPAICSACRVEKTTHHIGFAPLCSTCYKLFRDPDWEEELLLKPTEKQKQMMFNLSGEQWEGMDQSNIPDFVKEKVPFAPTKSKAEILGKLDTEAKQAWEDAVAEWGAHLDASKLGQTLCRGDFDKRFFPSPFEQVANFKQFRESPRKTSVDWVLNVANWLCELTPAKGQGVGKRELLLAAKSATGQSDIFLEGLSGLVASKMSDEQYGYFEECLLEHPDSLFLRIVLAKEGLGFTDAESRKKRAVHQLWLVQHFPELGDNDWLARPNDPHGVNLLLAWSDRLEKHPSDTRVLSGAADFFKLKQEELSLALYQRCLELEPQNPKWPREILFQMSLMSDEDIDWDQVEEMISDYEPNARGSILALHIIDVFESEDYPRAKRLAKELLELSQSHDDWNTGNAHFKAHTVLGLLAAREGNVELAEHHLIQSADTDGSPQMNSFGPNMTLAEVLLENGTSKEVVIDFLDLCSRFWKSESLSLWVSQVKAGEIPEFGSNLRY